MSRLENRQDSDHDVRILRHDEMDAVTGAKGISFFEALARAWAEALNKHAETIG